MLGPMPLPTAGLSSSDLERLPIFPLPNAVLFPGALLPLHVFENRYRELTRDVLRGRRRLVIARLLPGFEEDYYGRPPIFPVCGAGEIVHEVQRSDGRYDIVVRGLSRVRVLQELTDPRPYRLARVEALQDQPPRHAATLSAWQRQLALLWERLKPHLPSSARDLNALLRDAGGAGACADRIAEALVADPDDRQRLLEELDPGERFECLVERLQELVFALAPGAAESRTELN